MAVRYHEPVRLDEGKRAKWDEPMHRFVLRLPLRLAKRYYDLSQKRGISMNSLLVEVLERYLKDSAA